MKNQYKLTIVPLIIWTFLSACSQNQPRGQANNLKYLEVYKMRKSILSTNDTKLTSLIPIEIYPAFNKGYPSDSMPWADTYICKYFKRSDSLRQSSDTVVVLDTNKLKQWENERPSDYVMTIEKQQGFKRYKVNLTQKEIEKVRSYQYIFGKVTLITDD